MTETATASLDLLENLSFPYRTYRKNVGYLVMFSGSTEQPEYEARFEDFSSSISGKVNDELVIISGSAVQAEPFYGDLSDNIFLLLNNINLPLPQSFTQLDKRKLTRNIKMSAQREETIVDRMRFIFKKAESDLFETGIISEFSRNLEEIIKIYGVPAIDVLGDLIYSTTNEVTVEALQALGRLHHNPTYESRLWILERCLTNSDPKTRDAAGLGLASMNDPRALPYVKRAVEKEPINSLRDDLGLVLNQLENQHRDEISSQN